MDASFGVWELSSDLCRIATRNAGAIDGSEVQTASDAEHATFQPTGSGSHLDLHLSKAFIR
jgi:hypothetical protein